MNSRNELGSILEERGLNGVGIEIGVATGKFSKILLDTTQLNVIYFLDAWKHFSLEEYNDPTNASQKRQDISYENTVKKLSLYGSRAQIIRKDCTDAVKDFEDSYFDFIYIDANHEYSHIKRDLEEWYPKLKDGGLFSGHDYVDSFGRGRQCGVKKAVDEFVLELDLKVSATGGTRRCPSSWFFIK